MLSFKCCYLNVVLRHKLYDSRSPDAVSTILVMGGSGDYFDVADTVIAMHNYIPYNVTEQAANPQADLALFRPLELTAALNRLRTLQVVGCVRQVP